MKYLGRWVGTYVFGIIFQYTSQLVLACSICLNEGFHHLILNSTMQFYHDLINCLHIGR